MKPYNNLGQLLKEYREFFSLIQEQFAEKLDVELKTYQRWERNSFLPKKENLIRISKTTGIPMSTLILLNSGQRVFYSITKRRMATGKLDSKTLFLSELLTVKGVPEDEGSTLEFQTIENPKHVQLIKDYDYPLYPSNHTISHQVLLKAASILPEMNFIVLDQWKSHIGHHTCIPLSNSAYNKFKNQEIAEKDFCPNDLSDVFAFREGVLLFWSFYGSTHSVFYNILYKMRQHIGKYEGNNNIKVATYSITTEAHDLVKKLGLKVIFENHDDPCAGETDEIPTLYESTLDHVMKINS